MREITPYVLTSELQDAILALATREDIKSISCPFDEFLLWEGLLKEQVRRAKANALPAHHALFLSGPDSGIPGITSPRSLYFEDEDEFAGLPPIADPRTGGLAPHRWGGVVHIPYEGVCGGDLLILPRWFKVRVANYSLCGRKLGTLLWGKKCNYLLTNRALGDLPRTKREMLAGWNLYISTSPYEDCCSFRESDLM